jgi:hypothetical protein
MASALETVCEYLIRAAMGEQLPPRRKPRNDLLRNYYGIGSKASGKGSNAADIGEILCL